VVAAVVASLTDRQVRLLSHSGVAWP